MDPFEPPQSIGECIYCGAAGPNLQVEHVIPYGLNGTWELREASCVTCAAITSRFERDVLRNALFAPRAALGFRSYRKKKRPKSLPLTIDRGSGPETNDVAVAEHPALAVFPQYALPAWLCGRTRRTGIDVTGALAAHFGAEHPAAFARRHDGAKLTVAANYEPVAFARMVAKIAYGFCVARFGLDAVRGSYLRPAILGQSDDVGTWVGSTQGYFAELSPKPKRRVNHLVGTDVQRGDIVAYVRLFAWAVPSEYVVVVAPVGPSHNDQLAHNRRDLMPDV